MSGFPNSGEEPPSPHQMEIASELVKQISKVNVSMGQFTKEVAEQAAATMEQLSESIKELRINFLEHHAHSILEHEATPDCKDVCLFISAEVKCRIWGEFQHSGEDTISLWMIKKEGVVTYMSWTGSGSDGTTTQEEPLVFSRNYAHQIYHENNLTMHTVNL